MPQPLRTFKIGDRIAYNNLGFYSFGSIASVAGPDRYTITWDDGYVEAFGWDEDEGYYSSNEFIPESEVR